MGRRTLIVTVLAIVVVVLVTIGSYRFYFASKVNAPPKPVSMAKCTTQPAAGALRSFTIVPGQSTASYKVHENLILRNLPSTDAVGKTHDVTGAFQISTTPAPQVTSLHLTVNLNTLRTDESMRDRFVRTLALETDLYPNADFASTCTQGMPTHYSNGKPLSFQLLGNLTMHGKTRQETFAVTGKLSDKTISGTATTTLLMTDFDIQPPNLASIAIAQNKVLVTINFIAQEK
ncbi:YceI family protein [Dictyobacter formicarum]|uniref:Lipid/polyisoprenoid-binding YceI-like domain-containing protein n=1 Tax=Dictyobacter formicarum TaxID=2778368 RepID=A0ABQ3VEE8_9CHLR|nr:YceI family protein [Dictyobacter formicarum]GHO84165.1 hypothetical protein KSZ_21710 [Dictyobacter formicarum]